MNDEEYQGELNSKYHPRAQTSNNQKIMLSKERRLVKTAKLHRQKL